MKVNRQVRGIIGPAPGFTLVEMLTVMILMSLILMAAAVTWNNVKRGAEMRTAINDVRSSLALARQYAVLKKTTIRFSISAANLQLYTISDLANGRLLRGGPQELPLGITFTNPPAGPIDFRPSGAIQGNQNVDLILVDRLNPNDANHLRLNGLTGIINYD